MPAKNLLMQDTLAQVRLFLQDDIKSAISQAVTQSVQAYEKLQQVSSNTLNKTFLNEMHDLLETIETLNVKHRNEMNELRAIMEG